MAGSVDGQEAGPCRRRGRRQPLAFRQRHRLVLGAVHDEPGHCDSRRGRLDVEGRGVSLDVIEHVGVEREDLARCGRSSPRCTPACASGPRSGCGHRSTVEMAAHVTSARTRGSLAACSTDDAPAPRMPQQPERASAARRPSSPAVEGLDHPAQVLQLGGERVVAEPLGEDELAGVVHAAPAQVEA